MFVTVSVNVPVPPCTIVCVAGVFVIVRSGCVTGPDGRHRRQPDVIAGAGIVADWWRRLRAALVAQPERDAADGKEVAFQQPCVVRIPEEVIRVASGRRIGAVVLDDDDRRSGRRHVPVRPSSLSASCCPVSLMLTSPVTLSSPVPSGPIVCSVVGVVDLEGATVGGAWETAEGAGAILHGEGAQPSAIRKCERPRPERSSARCRWRRPQRSVRPVRL